MIPLQALTLTTPSDREISWVRDFDAPRRLVFDALTKPELIRRWLLGPPGWEMTECRVDLRVGGEYRWAWKHPEQGSMGMGGVYREIVRSEKLVSTEKYGQGWYSGEAVGTAVLVENQGKTTLHTTMLYESLEARNQALKSGMDTGLNFGYAQMDRVLQEWKGRGKRILQSVLALAGGFAVVFVLSIATDMILEALGVFPPVSQPQAATPGTLLLALIYRSVYSVFGFFLTALWAPRCPLKHAVILGVAGTFVAALGAVANWNLGNQWYPVLLAVVTLPCAWLGAQLQTLTKKKEN